MKILGVVLGTVLANMLYWRLANMLYLEPETTRIMVRRHAVERRLGTGQEIGQLRLSDPIKANNLELRALSEKFVVLHGILTAHKLVALGFSCFWINFVALGMGKKRCQALCLSGWKVCGGQHMWAQHKS